MRINKFISNSGICSRRNADLLIEKGEIEVNGKIVTTPGLDIKETDIVKYNGKIVNLNNDNVYFLLNKPINYISSCVDKEKRKTVLDLIKIKNKRIYPVGRLDRNTTGLIILTNDGVLTNKLTHPSSEIIKKYWILIDKPITTKTEQTLKKGIFLEDGYFKFDKISISENKTEIKVVMHSGRNRIIRRTFLHLGYNVKALDRYYYAGLTKGKLKLGEYRNLTKDEVNTLKSI